MFDFLWPSLKTHKQEGMRHLWLPHLKTSIGACVIWLPCPRNSEEKSGVCTDSPMLAILQEDCGESIRGRGANRLCQQLGHQKVSYILCKCSYQWQISLDILWAGTVNCYVEGTVMDRSVELI